MQTIVFGARTLVIVHVTEVAALSKVARPFAMLLSATPDCRSLDEQRIINGAAASGCLEFCCVGDNSEDLHDYVDGILEDRGLLDVVTTWHAAESMEEALFYFVHLAGSRPPTLVAVIGKEPGLLKALEEAIAESG